MRKFANIKGVDPETFEVYQIIKEKNEDGTVIELLREKITSHPLSGRYTPDEIKDIEKVNSVLEAKGESKLTDAEMDFLIDPLGLKRRSSTEQPEDMQRLAGFKVEKKIISL